MSSVARHYGLPGLLDAIFDALRAQGKDPERLNPEDFAPVDEFHIRGQEASNELAELAQVQANLRVLDVGSGLGGSARFLAAKFGCRVTGVDLTPEYCEAAKTLSARVGLEALTDFRCASALEMPFGDGEFDLAWTQHVQMNIENKPALYEEIRRVLRAGGRFALHDILAGPAGTAHFPVHWAETPDMSFLIAPDELKELLENTGFRVVEWRDLTHKSREWFLAAVEKRRAAGVPPLGLHLLLGKTAPQKFENVARNLLENRIRVFQGVWEKI